MLLRISLGIVILAGLGALYFSQFPVKQKIDTLTTDLQTAQNDKQTAQENERKARAEATKARSDLDTTKKELNDKTATL